MKIIILEEAYLIDKSAKVIIFFCASTCNRKPPLYPSSANQAIPKYNSRRNIGKV